MTLLTTLTRAAGLGLCVVAFAGTALADPGNGNGPAATPPGQAQKAETPAAAAPAPAPENQGQEKKAEKAAAKAAKPAPAPAVASKGQAKKAAKAEKPTKAEKPAKAEKPTKPAKTSGSYKATSSGTDLKKGMSHKHTICHATGSESNPYVRITPSVSGVYNGHMGHQDGEDIVPPFTYKGVTYSQNWDAEGQAIFHAGCAAPAPAAPVVPAATPTTKQTSGECPATVTSTERVAIGVWHATGAMKDGKRKYVFITPSLGSAHYDSSKHEDDIPVYETRTVSTTEANANCEKTVVKTSPQGPGTPEQPQPLVPTKAGTTPAPGTVGVLPAVTKAPAGSVLGAVSPAEAPAAEKQSAGGVLGAVASAPEAIARTATSGTLPFTGLPLWLAALVGAGLLTAGLALRRSA